MISSYLYPKKKNEMISIKKKKVRGISVLMLQLMGVLSCNSNKQLLLVLLGDMVSYDWV